ncbi:hypothetical protein [Cyanobium sp. ATX 6F1]|uniref:hypothetical protein n=1 Tax=Cyanobium sp. ATX 6F1 TaxID=2823702 RepID=UPI0020CBA65B|nr:hypothetical protein [Cyanobium sp. ATX 6F1]
MAETTYRNNCESRYTEKIESIEGGYCYEANRSHYWGPQELSLFFGTNLYRQSTPEQKLALNHLYWVTQYNQTAATEANAVLYNNVTEGVFSAVGGFGALCSELSLETEQEHQHIHAFHAIGYATRKALFGSERIVRPRLSSLSATSRRNTKNSSAPPSLLSLKIPALNWTKLQDEACRLMILKLSSGGGSCSYSDFLRSQQRSGKPIPVQRAGLLGQVVPASLSRIMTISFGASPFSACFFYAIRYLANILLKNYEHSYFQFHRSLERAGDFIPAPTAISYYHMLDESFHTTTSQLISQDLYKEFPRPTAYEHLMANLIFYRGQQMMLGGLSAVLPGIFRSDSTFILPLYQILRSSLYGLPHQEALYWLEQSLCQEHEGHHVNLKYHQKLHTTMRQAFKPMSYLWPINRELGLMASGASIVKSLRVNRQAFEAMRPTLAQLDQH